MGVGKSPKFSLAHSNKRRAFTAAEAQNLSRCPSHETLSRVSMITYLMCFASLIYFKVSSRVKKKNRAVAYSLCVFCPVWPAVVRHSAYCLMCAARCLISFCVCGHCTGKGLPSIWPSLSFGHTHTAVITCDDLSRGKLKRKRQKISGYILLWFSRMSS